MRVALIGATGFIGSSILKELLNRNFSIKVFARNTDTIEDKKNIAKVSLDVNNIQLLAAELKGADVVVSAFNAGWQNPELYNDFVKGSKSIEEATKLAGVKRLIVIGSTGSLFVNKEKKLQIVDVPEFPREIKTGARAARDYYNVLKKNKELDWTVFSPALEILNSNSQMPKGVYRTGSDLPVVDKKGRSTLHLGDLALAIVDEIKNNKFKKQMFTAAY